MLLIKGPFSRPFHGLFLKEGKAVFNFCVYQKTKVKVKKPLDFLFKYKFTNVLYVIEETIW